MRIEPTQETLLERLQVLLWEKDFEFAELLGGLAGLLWGAWLLNPSWDAFEITPGFAAMAAIAPEPVWGSALLLIGALQLWALIRDRWPWRRRSAFLLFCAWMFITVMIGRANYRAAAVVVYPLLALSAAWAYIRMRFQRV